MLILLIMDYSVPWLYFLLIMTKMTIIIITIIIIIIIIIWGTNTKGCLLLSVFLVH